MQKQRKAVKQDKIIIAESLNGLLWWLSGKESACNAEDTGEAGSVPGQEDPLEEAMATHSSIFVSRIPWTEETGGLQSLGSQRVRYDWSNWAQQRDRSHSTKAKVFSSFSRATDNILSHVLWAALQIRKLPPGRRSYQTVAMTQSALSYTLPRAGLQMETNQPGNWRLTALKQSRWHDQTTAGSISRRLHVIPTPSPVPRTPETPLLKLLTPDWW